MDELELLKYSEETEIRNIIDRDRKTIRKINEESESEEVDSETD